MALHARRGEGGVEVNLNSFLFNNQPDTLFIQIYSVINLYMFRTTSMSIIRTASKQSQDGTFILTLLGNGNQNLYETYQYRMYNRILLMMGKEVAQNM
jgi:hypothetical protein